MEEIGGCNELGRADICRRCRSQARKLWRPMMYVFNSICSFQMNWLPLNCGLSEFNIWVQAIFHAGILKLELLDQGWAIILPEGPHW